MIEIRNLELTDFDALFGGFERAFSDYAIHFEKEEVRSLLKRRGYEPRLSFAAFDNNEIVAFTLNGIGIFNGVPTAYDTGTGTVKAYRGLGLAGKIFNHALPYLKAEGIGQYLLEVLQNNEKAISVYRRMDFKTSREFDCFRQNIQEIDTRSDLAEKCRIVPMEVDVIRQSQGFGDFCPSWQNSMESIERGLEGLTCLGAEIDGRTVGYCVFDASTGDLTQIAVSREFRRHGIATQLLHEATARMKTDFVKVLNVDCCDNFLATFLKSRNICPASKQYEMIRQL